MTWEQRGKSLQAFLLYLLYGAKRMVFESFGY